MDSATFRLIRTSMCNDPAWRLRTARCTSPSRHITITILKLSANLSVLDWFAPANQSYLNTTDFDLGAGGTLLLPDQTGTTHTHELVTYGKDPAGTIYVLDRDNLGHYKSSGNTQIVQSFSRQ